MTSALSGKIALITALPTEGFRHVLEVNALGIFLGLKLVIPVMAKARVRQHHQLVQRRGDHRLAGTKRLCRQQARRPGPEAGGGSSVGRQGGAGELDQSRPY
jgi:NAD(P)-dependent dehydrogenase (short-subunit alcohol dehydrogenase family)